MLSWLVFGIFLAGYLLISFAGGRLNKSAIAVLTGCIIWALLLIVSPEFSDLPQKHLPGISSIIFFLIGAMILVEVMDSSGSFRYFYPFFNGLGPKKFFWLITGITFILSALLDNLTTSLVMLSFLRASKMGPNNLKWMGVMVIISANAGGAWSPIGDITTTMLWMEGRFNAMSIIRSLFIPSLISILIPGWWISGKIQSMEKISPSNMKDSPVFLLAGLIMLMGVPVLHEYFHIPPWISILLAAGILWLFHDTTFKAALKGSTSGILEKIDMQTLLFFLGILMAVAGLEEAGTLKIFSGALHHFFPDFRISACLMGLLSSFVDNIPLVSASVSLYADYPSGHIIWEYIAYCCGTGGSILLWGSAAGVAVAGLAKLDFVWYFKNATPWILLGYFSGLTCILLQGFFLQ